MRTVTASQVLYRKRSAVVNRETVRHIAEKQKRSGGLKNRKIGFLRQVAYCIEAVFVVAFGTFLSVLPHKSAKVLARFAGILAFHLDKRDRKWACRNLDILYPQPPLSKDQKDRIIRKLFINIGLGACEYLKIADLTAENYEDFVRFGDYRALEQALEEKKGVLAISAHMGNWEYLGSVVAKLGLNVATVIKHQHNPYTDKWLREIREKKGRVKCFYNNDPFLTIHIGSHLKQNGIIAMLADQRQVSKPLFVPFFGVPSATSDGPAKLHLWYDVPIVFCFSVKQNDGKYLLSVEGPYHFPRSDDLKADCRNIMMRINQKYEEIIRKYPDQWFSILTPRWEKI